MATPLPQVEPSAPSAVKLRPSMDARQQCGFCINFLPPAACSLVSGKVAPDQVCDLFTSNAEGEGGEAMPPDPAGLDKMLFGG